MSRLPSDAASRNMSACRAQAMSQVGCRLMVASRANTSLPRPPSACGDIARALATKAAISSEVEDLLSGSDPAPSALGDETVSPRFGLVGSPGIDARLWLPSQDAAPSVSAPSPACVRYPSVHRGRRA